jgi:hypothetical protein
LADEQQKAGFVEPEIEELKIGAKLTGSLDDISKRLSSLELFYLKQNPDSIVLLRIESRDIQKRPFLFFLLTLNRDSVVVQYSIAPDSSVKMRRLYLIKNLLNVLSLISDVYTVDNAELFQHADSAIDDVVNSIPQSYSALYNTYDSLYNEYKEMRRLNIELTASNKNLTVQGMQLSNENRDLQAKLKELQTYSDEALMARVQDWIESHDSTIDIDEFSKVNGVIPPRVEQVLNTMISRGYIEVKG